MAAEKTPIGFDPLSADGDGTPSGALSKILSNVGRNDKDEWLAFAGGMGQPNAGGSFTGALGNALKSQSDYRMERDKLMAQYVPLIQQSMVAQFENQRLQQIFGPGGIGAIGQPAQQQGATSAAQQDAAPAQPAAQGAPQGAPTEGAGPALPPNASPDHQPIGLGALNPGQLAAIKAYTGGKIDLLPEWKVLKEGFVRQPGTFVEDGNGRRRFIEDIKSGLGYDADAQTMYRLKGSRALADLAGEAAGAQTGAQEKAKLPFQPPTEVTTKDENGNLKSVKMTPAQQIEAATGINPLGPQGAGAAPGGITNPGNLRPPGTSTGFASFKTPEEGLSALDKNLQSYGKQGVNTVSAIINKWAPPSENDTAAYIADVSKRLSVNPGQPLDMTNPIVRQALSTAITLHEQGPAKVFTAQAPTGAGMPVASSADVEAGKTRAQVSEQEGQKYQSALHDKVDEDFQLVRRNQQIEPLLSKFQTGGMAAEERLHFGNVIANTGMLPDKLKAQLGSWIAGGDPTAGKVLENQLATAGINNLLQALNGAKPNRAEFQVMNTARESLNSGNPTLKDVFALQKRLYEIHYNEQQALTKAIENKTYNPQTWAGNYSKVRNDSLAQPAEPLPSSPFHGFTAKLKQ